jgi:endo-1,4-beta-xylanase
MPDRTVSRRGFLLGAAGAVATGLIGCSSSKEKAAGGVTTTLPDVACRDEKTGGRTPLWQTAFANGLVYGSSIATWQLDPTYSKLFAREAAILFTEDDLLWYRLKPTPKADLDFKYGDQIVEFAEKNGMLVLGAHLVWDEGFGEGWTDDDLWGLEEKAASKLLFGTLDEVVNHYRGRVAAWIVANEVLDGSGVRTDVPWYTTIGPSYIEEAFHRAQAADPDALLLLNDYGYETDVDTDVAADRRAAALQFIDESLATDVPIQALGVQAHLNAQGFVEKFDADAYRKFLADVADRGLKILITEMDVLDDGLPADATQRDREVADVVKTYLDVALDEPAVGSLVTFGLSDRYTWLEEDYPRDDGHPRRPLAFDDKLKPKPAFSALQATLESAPPRTPLLKPPRC